MIACLFVCLLLFLLLLLVLFLYGLVATHASPKNLQKSFLFGGEKRPPEIRLHSQATIERALFFLSAVAFFDVFRGWS